MAQDRSLSILLVDDHADTVRVLRRLLEREGYGVLTAGSADEAADLAGRGGCRLVISDIGLGGRSGLELMAELRARHGLRGVALSGYTDRTDLAAARAAGFERFLAKPVQFDALLAAVRELAGAGPPAPTAGG